MRNVNWISDTRQQWRNVTKLEFFLAPESTRIFRFKINFTLREIRFLMLAESLARHAFILDDISLFI